ncbi:hypothetical protein IMY05_C4939000300 [Salix suchowensis]|nr:hypothetical protein IMY05_C4939000300 [Salix suchowensis]
MVKDKLPAKEEDLAIVEEAVEEDIAIDEETNAIYDCGRPISWVSQKTQHVRGGCNQYPTPGETLAMFYARSREFGVFPANLMDQENTGRRRFMTAMIYGGKSYIDLGSQWLRSDTEVEKILAEAGLDEEEMRNSAAAGPAAVVLVKVVIVVDAHGSGPKEGGVLDIATMKREGEGDVCVTLLSEDSPDQKASDEQECADDGGCGKTPPRPFKFYASHFLYNGVALCLRLIREPSKCQARRMRSFWCLQIRHQDAGSKDPKWWEY